MYGHNYFQSDTRRRFYQNLSGVLLPGIIEGPTAMR